MFRKFKLVPIDAEGEHPKNIEEIEKALREYNPTTRAMANLYGGIQDALFSRDKKKTKKISANELLHLVAANRMRIHRLLQGSNEAQTRFQEMSGEDTQKKSVDEETNEDLAEDEMAQKIKLEKEEKDPKEQMELIGESERSNLAIPTRFGKKFTQLAKIISGTIGSNRLGEVIIRGETLRNTSYSDVMRALYVDSKFTIPGLVETVAELKRLGVKTSMFTSRNARQLYSVPTSDKLYLQQKGSGGSIEQRTFPRILRLY